MRAICRVRRIDQHIGNTRFRIAFIHIWYQAVQRFSVRLCRRCAVPIM